MVKGTIHAFDNMEFCLAINMTIGGDRAVIWPSRIATRNVSLATTCYLQEKLISNTEIQPVRLAFDGQYSILVVHKNASSSSKHVFRRRAITQAEQNYYDPDKT